MTSPYILDAVFQGKTADVYFQRTLHTLKSNNLDPIVDMEVFCKTDKPNTVLCGMKDVIELLKDAWARQPFRVWALKDGDLIQPREVVMRLQGHYQSFALYETAYLGMLASGTGWATAARECVDAAEGIPVTSFGARHIHPNVTAQMDYAAIVGGCKAGSCVLGETYCKMKPSGTMPHALVISALAACNYEQDLATRKAAFMYDQCMPDGVSRTVLVDTFRDEIEESISVARMFQEANRKLYAVRFDTPSERGGVRPGLVKEGRAKLNLNGFPDVKILVSGGFTPERIRQFVEEHAPVDGFGVGSYISGATPIDFTADIHAINSRLVAKRGRIPGITANMNKLKEVYL